MPMREREKEFSRPFNSWGKPVPTSAREKRKNSLKRGEEKGERGPAPFLPIMPMTSPSLTFKEEEREGEKKEKKSAMLRRKEEKKERKEVYLYTPTRSSRFPTRYRWGGKEKKKKRGRKQEREKKKKKRKRGKRKKARR